MQNRAVAKGMFAPHPCRGCGRVQIETGKIAWFASTGREEIPTCSELCARRVERRAAGAGGHHARR
jgi:hypothetical protein